MAVAAVSHTKHVSLIEDGGSDYNNILTRVNILTL